MDGLLIIDKPAGISSARAVDLVKRLLPRGTRIGHAGTLDPFATGVLVLLLGKATKRCEELMGQIKSYEATVKFGATTASDDPESPEVPTPAATPVNRDAIEIAIQQFRGKILQRPPAYSAIKLAGRRAYELARAGHQTQLESRPVQIHRIEISQYQWPLLDLSIDCGRGTYIRSIARDLGESLGVGGYLTQLRRTRVGALTIEQATPLTGISRETVNKLLRAI